MDKEEGAKNEMRRGKKVQVGAGVRRGSKQNV